MSSMLRSSSMTNERCRWNFWCHVRIVRILPWCKWCASWCLILNPYTWAVFEATHKSFSINNQIYKTCTIGRKLPKYNVFSDTSKCIMLTKESCFEQDFSSFFEGAFSQRSTVDSIYSMPCDRSKNTSLCHYIYQSSQVSIIHIDLISA